MKKDGKVSSSSRKIFDHRGKNEYTSTWNKGYVFRWKVKKAEELDINLDRKRIRSNLKRKEQLEKISVTIKREKWEKKKKKEIDIEILLKHAQKQFFECKNFYISEISLQHVN